MVMPQITIKANVSALSPSGLALLLAEMAADVTKNDQSTIELTSVDLFLQVRFAQLRN